MVKYLESEGQMHDRSARDEEEEDEEDDVD